MPAGLTGKPGRGDPLQLPAQAVSSFMDAAAAHRASQHSQRQESFPSRLRGGCVIVQNNTGSDRDQFDACTISGVALTPVATDDSRNTVFAVDTPATGDDPYICILQEPIAFGDCGLALVVGITPVNMQRASGDTSQTVGVADGQNYLQSGGSAAQILWEASGSGTHLAVVRLPLGGGSPSAHPATVTAVSSGTFTVSLYDNGFGAAATDTDINVTLLSGTMPAVAAQIVVVSDQNGTPDYYYQGAESGGGITTVVAAGTVLTTPMDGVTVTAGQSVLLTTAYSGNSAGVWTYTGTGWTFVSSPGAVFVGPGGTNNGNLPFSLSGGAYSAVGYAWG